MSMGILGGPNTLGQLTTDLFDWLNPTPPLMQSSSGQPSTPEQAALVTKTSTSSSGGGLMPWGVANETTKQFQQAVNAALTAKGKPTITADGKLGPATCAAAKFAGMDPGGGACKSYGVYPPGGGGSSYIAPAAAVTAPSSAAMYAPKSKSNALMIGALVGGLALVGLIVAKKKGWIK